MTNPLVAEMGSEQQITTDRDNRWQAVLGRDKTQDGIFYYAVASTGVYCRPSCPSRRPKREGVRFFNRPEQAEKAGFRPCLRCRPRSAGAGSPEQQLVTEACRFIEQHLDEPITLARLGEEFGKSPFHFQKTFKAVLGVSPRQYADSCRMKSFKQQLQAGEPVTKAIYDVGFSSSSRLYERSAAQLGMTPDTYRRGAVGNLVRYTTMDSPLGRILVAATQKGICSIRFGESDTELEHGLRREFPFAQRRREDTGLREYTVALNNYFQGTTPNPRLPLDIRATAFQKRVWTHLQSIPRGSTESYSEVARAVGTPTGARAVARACASNPVALAIPCHRVVRRGGDLGGYRWGARRKRALLAMESSAGPDARRAAVSQI